MGTIKNYVQLIGHLGKDVEVKKFDNGGVIANMTLATNEPYKNAKGEKVENTQWHRLVARGKTAELMADLLSKGSEVLVQGKLVHRDYEDKSGVKKYITEVAVGEFLKLDKPSKAPF